MVKSKREEVGKGDEEWWDVLEEEEGKEEVEEEGEGKGE